MFILTVIFLGLVVIGTFGTYEWVSNEMERLNFREQPTFLASAFAAVVAFAVLLRLFLAWVRY